MRLPAVLLVLLAACARIVPNALDPVAEGAFGQCPERETLSIYYYGSGGYLMRYGSHAFLTGGMVTNPHFGAILLPVRADSAKVRQYFADVATPGIDFVLTGHSHYDHFMDVPEIVGRYAPAATVLGSHTSKMLLAWTSVNVLAVGGDSVVTRRHQAPIPILYPAVNPRFRVTVFEWRHAPNLGEWTIAPGKRRTPQVERPRFVDEWDMGDVRAYLVDVLRPDGSTAFRIHYSDAAAGYSQWLVPRSVDDGVTRVAVISAGNFDLALRYPHQTLRRFRPHFTVVGHWETFFNKHDPRRRAAPIPFLDTDQLARTLVREAPGRPWAAPRPGAMLRVCPDTSTLKRQ